MVRPLAVLCAVELSVAVLLVLALTSGADAGAAAAAEPAPRVVTLAGSEVAPGSVPAAAGAAAAPAGTDAAKGDDHGDAGRAVVAPKVRTDDPVGVLLTGTVRWRDGGPVAEPRVWTRSGKETRSASSGKDGSFALARLAPGDWQIHVTVEGGVDFETAVAIGDDAVQQHDFVLDRTFPVRVLIVTPDGQDATRAARMQLHLSSDFHVVGQQERFPDRLAPTDYGIAIVGDAKWDREMNPEHGFAGTLSFVEPLPGHAALLLRHLVIDQQVVQPDQKEVRFVVDVEALKAQLGSATVRIVDAATGTPIAGVSAGLNTSSAMGPGPKSDADGRIEFENLPPGLLQFTIWTKEHEALYQVVRIDAGQHLDLGEVRLGAPQSLKGRVVDADGKPAVANLSWTELKWRNAPTEFSHNRHARTEADGAFELWGTGAGAIAVTAYSQDGRVAAAVFDNPPPVPVELRLQPAFECVVTRPKDPTRMFVVTLYDDRHRAVAAVAIEPRMLEHRLSMPPGDYAFDVHDDAGRLLQSGTLQFGATAARLEIR